jgi:hypothetical protein
MRAAAFVLSSLLVFFVSSSKLTSLRRGLVNTRMPHEMLQPHLVLVLLLPDASLQLRTEAAVDQGLEVGRADLRLRARGSRWCA